MLDASGQSPAVLPLLLDLEMRGIVVSCGSGAYALARPLEDSDER